MGLLLQVSPRSSSVKIYISPTAPTAAALCLKGKEIIKMFLPAQVPSNWDSSIGPTILTNTQKKKNHLAFSMLAQYAITWALAQKRKVWAGVR